MFHIVSTDGGVLLNMCSQDYDHALVQSINSYFNHVISENTSSKQKKAN